MFTKDDDLYTNEEGDVEYDLGDSSLPVMVDCDGWMSLADAKKVRDDLTTAINQVEAHLANSKPD